MDQYLKSFDTIRLYAPCNFFRKFSYIFSIFISNLKTRQNLHWFDFFISTTGFQSNQTGIPVVPVGIPIWTDWTRILNWDLNSSGSRSNRTGIPIPELAGSVHGTGIKNPVSECIQNDTSSFCQRNQCWLNWETSTSRRLCAQLSGHSMLGKSGAA
jgi:hypothetical protein